MSTKHLEELTEVERRLTVKLHEEYQQELAQL